MIYQKGIELTKREMGGTMEGNRPGFRTSVKIWGFSDRKEKSLGGGGEPTKEIKSRSRGYPAGTTFVQAEENHQGKEWQGERKKGRVRGGEGGFRKVSRGAVDKGMGWKVVEEGQKTENSLSKKRFKRGGL